MNTPPAPQSIPPSHRSSKRIERHPGDIIGKFTFVREHPKSKAGGKRRGVFVCHCGREFICDITRANNGTQGSCGCIKVAFLKARFTKHGMGTHRNRMYRLWTAMKTRCHNPNAAAYRYYGQLGITVCDRWNNSFVDFMEDLKVIGITKLKPGESLDRIDGTKGYEPGNVRAADKFVQANNTKSNHRYPFNGELLTIPQICRLTGLSRHFLRYRIEDLGQTMEQAVRSGINPPAP